MFSQFFINRPIFALVISIVIVLVGVLSIPILPVESMPDITPPTVKVVTQYPGADAQVVVDAVTTPIEQQINGVENMIYMSSKSSADGKMDLTVTFDIGTDPDMAQVLTQNRVAIAEPLLPEEVKRQGVVTKKQSTALVLFVSMTSPDGRFDDLYISNYVTTRIKDQLARVNGVGEVLVFGAKDFGMRIWVDPDRLKARGLTADELVGALREQNVQVAAGKVGTPPNPAGLPFELTILTQGRLTEVAQFEEIVVKTGRRGELVRVRDVARVELGAQAYNWYAQLDGNTAIALGIYQQPGSNAMAVAQGVRAAMDEMAADFPEGLAYAVPYDSTRYIDASIKEVINTLLVAILLVILTVYIFLQDFRATVVPAVTIPVSLIGTFAAMQAMGMSINNLTLFGLVLAIGIVVDDAIVVVENTQRLIDDEKMKAKDAVSRAMREVAGPVIATTLVLLAVFVPTTMIPGMVGRLYKQFAITISVATVFSSINALTLSPALCGLLLRPSPETRNRFFNWFNRGFDVSTAKYTGWTSAILRKTAVVALVFLALLGATGLGLTSLPTGFLPLEDQGYFFVNVQLPNGASLERTAEVLEHVNTMLLETPGVTNVVSVGGYSLLDGVASTNTAMAVVTLAPWDDRKTEELHVDGIIKTIQPKLWMMPQAVAFAFPPPAITGLGQAGGFEMQLQDRGGLGVLQLEQAASELVAAGNASPLLTRMNQNLRATVPQIYLDVDRERAKAYHVPLSRVFNTLGIELGGAYVNDFNLFGRTWRVMAQADEQYRARPEDILKLEVRSSTGHMIPLGTVATVRDTVGPSNITRFNMFNSATVTGSGVPGVSSGAATDELERLAGGILPGGMGYAWSGVTFQEKAAGNLAAVIFALAIVFVFLFLAAQYESWHVPLAVMFAVPMAILGAAVATMSRSLDNNIYTQIGLVLLIGMASKNAILIVEFAKQLYEEGRSPFDAALEAARLRFRPILMTAFSFILGVIPLLIATGAGAASRRALGTAVFGGMLMATVLGVFLIPWLYRVIQEAAERFGWEKRPEPAAGGEVPTEPAG
jgi:HAE1 family hydrophobic/amphiphilic exporter-1